MAVSKLDRAMNIDDLRTMAKQRMPKALFDFVDGGAEDEVTLRDNRRQFDRWRLVARHPVNVARRDLSVEIFGKRQFAPFVISPTGLAAFARGRAEVALAQGAHRMGVPVAISTAASVGIEDLANSSDGPRWFQLYILKDRGLSETMIERARRSGYSALVISVDCPVVGQRERDLRNGLSIPLRPTFANIVDLLGKPAWVADFLKHGAPQPENFSGLGPSGGQALTAHMQQLLDPSVSWADIAWVRKRWDGPMIVKGLISATDAELAVAHGADGVVVSNQGGRQLDHAVPTIEALPHIVDAIGDRCTIFCDGGFRRGTDIAKALALGAKAVFLGRATLFGAAAGGAEGVYRALDILYRELDRAMALTGCSRPELLDRTALWDLAHAVPIVGQALTP